MHLWTINIETSANYQRKRSSKMGGDDLSRWRGLEFPQFLELKKQNLVFFNKSMIWKILKNLLTHINIQILRNYPLKWYLKTGSDNKFMVGAFLGHFHYSSLKLNKPLEFFGFLYKSMIWKIPKNLLNEHK